MTQNTDRPFSHLLERKALDGPLTLTVTADAQARAAIVAAFGLVGLAKLSGRFAFTPQPDGQILTRLDLTARVTQSCIVTLEPVEQAIAERAALILADASIEEPEDWLDPDQPDWVPISGPTIDLGALLTDQLALALDPYPRKPDAELPDAARAARENPFTRLKRD
ncbi:MAG TPA: DUF177 domain-containing protein [Acidiphilium sp.]|nr:DUF177 domain-containing protein [Acidiphilium sp.]HQU23253.1 DUF177 domain-containing protein [Acidiphilium sp.]